MANQAPPMPEIEAEGPDAFAAVAHRLDALLQGKAKAERVQATEHAVQDEHDASPFEPAGQSASAPVIDLDLPPHTPEHGAGADTPAPEPAAPRPETAGDIGADLMSTMDNIDAILSGVGTGEADAASVPDPAPLNVELPDLDAPAQAQSPDESVATTPTTDPVENALPDTAADDPSANDLDAELAALLAEQPIDPEVLGAAEEIAQRDAEAAEQNREALRLRAEHAALALEQAETDTQQADEADITDEINQLLIAEEEQAPLADPGGDSPAEDPSIDQIDQMLAADADDDLDLDGAFFSADDVLAGNTAGPGDVLDEFDEELDGDFAAAEDVPATEPTHDAEDATDEAGQTTPAWQRFLRLADAAGLQLCWLLNWPARKFLSTEWRSTLGYVALLQAAGAMAVWLLLVIL